MFFNLMTNAQLNVIIYSKGEMLWMKYAKT